MDSLAVWLPLILAVFGGLFAWGKLVAKIDALQTRIEDMEKSLKEKIIDVKVEVKGDINRLEVKQDKCNNLKERMAKEEADKETLFRRIGKVEDLIHEYHH